MPITIINNGLSDIIEHYAKIMCITGCVFLVIICCFCYGTIRLVKRFTRDNLAYIDDEDENINQKKLNN